MIKIIGNTANNEIANAIHAYNKAPIYSYGDHLPPFTECQHIDKNDVTVREFCEYILRDLRQKTKDSPLPMIVIYTNESVPRDIEALEDYSNIYEHYRYVGNVVLMTR